MSFAALGRTAVTAVALCLAGQLPLACGSSGAAQPDAGQAGAGAQGSGGAFSDAGEGPVSTGGESLQTDCAQLLSPDFRLAFEEVPLEGEPEEITDFKLVPDEPEQLVLLDKQGRLRLYELSQTGGALLDELQVPDVFGEDDCGAVSIAFDPGYADNRFVYVGHCLTGTSSRITRLTLDAAFADAAESAVAIIEVGDARSTRPWHNVGSIGFDDDSVMWALFGEKTVTSNAQDGSVPLGKLLRIIPSREPGVGGFEPAPDNDPAAEDPSVYARGVRSPWKGARDELGRYWIGDVGADNWEELNVVPAAGTNLGWPVAEGVCQAECSAYTDPVLAYPHSLNDDYSPQDAQAEPTIARAIWVAGPFTSEVERDPYGCNLRHVMLFGDFFTGWVRAAAADAQGRLSIDQHLGHLRFASAFAQAADGTVYATSLGVYKNHGTDPRGRLYRAVAAKRAGAP